MIYALVSLDIGTRYAYKVLIARWGDPTKGEKAMKSKKATKKPKLRSSKNLTGVKPLTVYMKYSNLPD